MGNIVLLDENTINKIAAGEVVDRPSSIIKELVENSIDAGAKNISVEIKKGGISYIKITDDGIGFKSDDVEMAFERHATSKIRTESDILKVTSMGFRGEALASIAAISKVSLTTKNIDENIGTSINVEGGVIKELSKAASKTGTTIVIKDVFFNVPARFKFLKKDYIEAGYIEEVMIRMAIANPNISFKYINKGKIVLNTRGNNSLKDCIYSIFGKETYDNIIDLEFTYDNIKVFGVIGNSNISRSTRSNEYTFINSRFVKNKTMMGAIEKAYNEKLGIGKFPFVIINITIDPSLIDVNVHPAKLEVKFENEKQIFESIYYGIRNRLDEYNSLKNPFSIVKKNIDNKMQLQEKIEEAVINDNKTNIVNIPSKVENNIIEETKIKNDAIDYTKIESNLDFKINENIKVEEPKQEYIQENLINEIQDEIKNINLKYKYIGCVFNTYIIIEIDSKMYIIDQHACHERLLYEKFKDAFKTKNKETQMLMIPFLLELKSKDVNIVENNIEYFQKCGYVIEKFTDNSFKISGVPNVYNINMDDKSIILDIIDELAGNSTLKEEKEFRFLATVACKAAIKANMNMSKEEHIHLIDSMLNLENPFTCPHGRQIAYEMSKKDLEKKVDRR